MRDRRASRPGRIPRSRLAALRVAELRDLATSLGVVNVSSLRKGSLVDAITDSYDSNPSTEEAEAAQLPQTAPEEQQIPGDSTPEPTPQTPGEPGIPGAPEPIPAPAEPGVPLRADEAALVEAGAEQPAGDGVTTDEEAAVDDQQAEADPAPAEQQSGEGAPVAAVEQAEEAVTPAEAEVDAQQGGAPAEAVVPADTETTEPVDQQREEEAEGAPEGPRRAAQHVNAGLTGIAEDLQELQRREAGEAPEENRHDGAHPVETAEGEGRRGRGRSRNRGRGGQNAQNGQQGQGQGQGNGQQPQGQQNGQQGQQTQAEEAPKQELQPAKEQPAAQPQQELRRDDAQGDGRRGRYRDRKRRGGNEFDEPEIRDDDVLIPIAGILDVLDNYAFVRTSGYLPGPHDVYVSLGQVKKYSLRKGDAVVGAIRQVPETEQPSRQKYNALVKVDSINGLPVQQAEGRVEFGLLTPLYPQERLRLETESQKLATRLIDVVAPLGKGARGLLVAPAKSGKTLILQSIANAISKNNPEVHLMVVLVDERPEEVTDMQRTVKGEVIASTFDRAAEDHTTVAELAIERAKRLVELGYDVVVLLDSVTRLVRAYNQVVPATGRSVAGGLDAAALAPAKRFFGSARNVENGGSLTILATALDGTGSAADEAVLEEFAAAANTELKLSRHLAERRVYPAVDVNASGTRREELLMGPDEVKVTWRLRRALAGLDDQAALDVVLGKLKETGTNVEFLVQMQKSLPGGRGE
ncbi:transcription termination factor Rho [Amnibacterium sp. CER49]|uniref:transcription termination factor Rho n=1 Tax=Amnibacterium sp. CER49 TaxID=3039161 RepID=UPI00244A83E3|nr:transcription termination factor Rho [Amnibacterium sp. CER49]MDH2445102.1 transcription termination factor Rho [Amnibacterium sp. CER49]